MKYIKEGFDIEMSKLHVGKISFSKICFTEKHSRPLFSLFSSFQYSESIYKISPMTGSELQISGVGSNRSTN